MQPVLTREEMRAFDEFAITVARVPGIVLMENAARGAAEALVQRLFRGDATGRRVVVVCGAGNNGGDGYGMARHLYVRGAHVDVFALAPVKGGGDAVLQRDAWLGCGGSVRPLGDGGGLEALREALPQADAVVDALFGTGLDRPLEGLAAATVDVLNGGTALRVAVDIPSGLDANRGAILGKAVRADRTFTFAHFKTGLLTPRGADQGGVIECVPLGVPSDLPPAQGASVHLVEEADVVSWLPPRRASSHKGSVGHVACFAGSPGHGGAALLSAQGVLRAGGALVTICSRAETIEKLDGRVVEIMTYALEGAAPGIESSVEKALLGKKVAVAGPGLGLDAFGEHVLEALLRQDRTPLVLDADALTLLAKRPLEAPRNPPLVLTPHPGEAARLLQTTVAAIEADRYGAVRALAHRYGAVVLLKGAYSLVARPDGAVRVNPTGNAVLATAGSGDVLSGIVAAFLLHLAPFDAASAAAWVHGRSGERWAREHGDRGLLASELSEGVPNVLKDLGHRPTGESRG